MKTFATLATARRSLEAALHLCGPSSDLDAALPRQTRRLRSAAVATLAALDAMLDQSDELNAVDALDDEYVLAIPVPASGKAVRT